MYIGVAHRSSYRWKISTEEDDMRYLFLICIDPDVELTPEQVPVGPWVEEMTDRKARVLGDRVRPVSDATSVRVRDGDLLVSDGPFAETREHIGGFDIIECADLDEAIEIASKHPIAKYGTIDIRPVWPLD
jgi:hypothetical protein